MYRVYDQIIRNSFDVIPSAYIEVVNIDKYDIMVAFYKDLTTTDKTVLLISKYDKWLDVKHKLIREKENDKLSACPICMEDYSVDKQKETCVKCKYMYCMQCYIKQLRVENIQYKCPCCRYKALFPSCSHSKMSKRQLETFIMYRCMQTDTKYFHPEIINEEYDCGNEVDNFLSDIIDYLEENGFISANNNTDE